MRTLGLGLGIGQPRIGGGGPVWTPRDLSAVALGLVVPATLGAVASLPDASGHGRTATQATSAARPSVVAAAGPTGGPGLVFAGGLTSGTFLQTASFGLAGPVTAWLIAKIPPETYEQDLFDGLGVGTMRCGIIGGTAEAFVSSDGSSWVSGNITLGSWHLLELTFNGSSGKLVQDGVVINSGKSGGSAASAGGVTLGADGLGTLNFASMTMVEFWVQSGVATAADEANMHAYSTGVYATP